MTLAAFQDAFARLVSEPGFAAAVRDGAPVADLSEQERTRLVTAAADPGLDAARTVHVGWRLSKLLGLLPLTCAALGSQLGTRVQAYWAHHPPRSLYFEREAIAFGEAVRDDDAAAPAVREVAAFEVASLRLDVGDAEQVELRFAHDPDALLAAAAAGADLAALPRASATAIGRRGAAGDGHAWTVVRATA